jgi:hypothetical protein
VQHVLTIILLIAGINLLAIGPVKIGLYGDDPANTYRVLLLFRSTSDLTLLLHNLGWPQYLTKGLRSTVSDNEVTAETAVAPGVDAHS